MIQEVQCSKESERIPEPSRTVQRRWLESSGQLLREFPCEFQVCMECLYIGVPKEGRDFVFFLFMVFAIACYSYLYVQKNSQMLVNTPAQWLVSRRPQWSSSRWFMFQFGNASNLLIYHACIVYVLYVPASQNHRNLQCWTCSVCWFINP